MTIKNLFLDVHKMLLTCASFVLIWLIIVFLRYSFWRKTSCQHFPGKQPSFFNVLGDLADVWRSKDKHQGFMDMFRKRVELFKKEKLFCMWFLYDPLIVLIKADSIQELLMGDKMKDKSWVYNKLKYMMGTGLITSEGSKWKSRRRLLMPCFHAKVLRRFLIAFNEGAEKLVASLQEETTKDFTLITNPIKLCALGIIFETIFGVKINASDNEYLEYFDSFSRFQDLFIESIFTPWQWSSILFENSKSGKEFKHHSQVMKQLTRKIIREKRESYLRGETDTHEGKQKALMDLLMQKHLETQELSEEDIREEVDTFTLAGHETTATGIEWALYLIGLYSEVQAKLQEEMDQIFGNDTERQITERDIQDLQYLDCVLKESNRLYSSVPMIVRQANADTSVCGYAIPKGTSCIVFTYFLHRDENVFPDPEAFKPERFLPENSAGIPMCGYIPFAAGPRKCIGYKFAEMEMKVIVSSILRNFTIESLDERSKIQPLLKGTLQPSTPIRIRIRPRSEKERFTRC